jgi:hypothetical protein
MAAGFAIKNAIGSTHRTFSTSSLNSSMKRSTDVSVRIMLVIAGVLAVIGSYASWQANAGRLSTEATTRVTRSLRAPKGLPPGRSVTVHRSAEAPASSLRSQALTIALAALALVLLLAAAFWERLSELRIGNMWLKLMDPAHIRRIRERTDDSDKALEAVEIYLDKIEKALDRGRRVDPDLAQSTVDAAVAEVQSDLAGDIEVRDGEQPFIKVDGKPSEDRVLWATSEFQYLPPDYFQPDLVEQIQGDDPGRHAVYVLSLVDVLAAVSYEARLNTPLLVHALATRHGSAELEASALGAAMVAMRYLHKVSQALLRPPGLIVATNSDHFRLLTLQELGFRQAHRDETPGLPAGEYWIHDRVD